jgi:hypothetical protein
MNQNTLQDIQDWEDEGGAIQRPDKKANGQMRGTMNQVEWAERIKHDVSAEFDRVAAAFRAVADRQTGDERGDTDSVIAIVEDKRAEVLAKGEAGYFIHDWQEIGDQVRRLLLADARYQAIRARRAARRPMVPELPVKES